MLELNWPLDEIARVLGSESTAVAPDVRPMVRLVQTDSRKVTSGDLFVCLVGERFDAHDFAEQVREAGACALVTDRLLNVDMPQFVVPDTRLALGTLAAAWRAKFDLKVLAVVGSNGKTTSKEMLGSICKAQCGADKVLVTAGNLNNDIGVPQTLLELRPHHEMAVIEMGMNHPGEIDYLARLVKPDVVLLTNAQREHQEFMKSVEAVAEENGSAFLHLHARGTAVFPAETSFEDIWQAQAVACRVSRFGKGSDFEVSAATGQVSGELKLRAEGVQIAFTAAFMGEHNYLNAAGAAAAATAAGCSADALKRGLESFKPVSGRLQIALRSPRLMLINDTYNANPDSVNAASKVLCKQAGKRLLVLGDMGEVGDSSDEYHAEVGHIAKAVGVDFLYAIGEATQHTAAAFGTGATHFSDIEHLIQTIMNITSQGQWSVLVKGSRFMKMERVVKAFVEHYAGEAIHAS